MVPKKSQINSHLLFTHLQLIFQLSLRSFTHAKASPHWLILKSDNVFSIDMILISTHRPFSDRYIVSIDTSDNNLAENQVCFYNFQNTNNNRFFCFISGSVIWIHREKNEDGIIFKIFEVQVFTNIARKPEVEVTEEATLFQSSYVQGFLPSFVRDGDLTTYCETQSKPSWFQFKFSQTYKFSHVVIKTNPYKHDYGHLRIGMDKGNPTRVPVVAILIKVNEEFLKY